MARSSRTDAAARAALHGRAARLQREAVERGDAPKPARTRSARSKPAREQTAAEPGRAAKPARRKSAGPDRPAHQRHQLTPLHRVQERQERTDAAADRRHQQRLQEQTRSAFNRDADRRRDAVGRAEHDRQREAAQKVIRRIEDHRRQATRRQDDRRREQTRREFNKQADRRRDEASRVEHARKAAELAARQKELERRAAAQVEQEQKRRAQDQQSTHRRMTDAMRTRHGVERHGFRDAKALADERYCHGITASFERQDRELAEFDGRRKGLAGRVVELVGRTGVRNDRERDAIVQRHETDRRIATLDHEALKERQFEREQAARLDRMKEQKALFELIRGEREQAVREFAVDRPRLVEERARVIERTDQAHDQQREREREAPPRENARPSGDFSQAAPDIREASTSRDHAADGPEVQREAARDISAERVLERA